MQVTRAPGTYFAEEVLERVVEGGIILDGSSRLLAAVDSGPFKATTSADALEDRTLPGDPRRIAA